MADQRVANKWHAEEEAWWNKHGEYMTYQWKLTPSINKIIRADLEKDFTKYLFTPQGSLLDLGCGSGWLSHQFAENGMSVLGIDFSQEQIDAANKSKPRHNMDNLSFDCCDLVQWDHIKYKEHFDSVFVNAFLHHLPPAEIALILEKVEYVLKQGGKVFLYEPLTDGRATKSCLLALVDTILNYGMGLLLNLMPNWFRLWSSDYKNKIKEGYSLCSPHEAPIELTLINDVCKHSFEISEIKGWHIFSLGFAFQTMALKSPARALYSRFVRCWYLTDRILIKLFNWQQFSRPDRFIMCGIKLIKIGGEKHHA